MAGADIGGKIQRNLFLKASFVGCSDSPFT
jgi:hypothetical protein